MNPTPEPLVVDRSVPRHVDDRDLHAGTTTQTVFVSSVMAGMVNERTAVADALERIGTQPVLFERLGGRTDDAETGYLDGVRSSDIYVGVLGALDGGRAQRITALRVGPKRRGSRRVLLEWLPRQRYTNVLPDVRRVEGEVHA